MKRFVTAILSVAMLLSITMTTAFAVEDVNMWDDTNATSAVEIYDQAEINYNLSIPTSADSMIEAIDLIDPVGVNALSYSNGDLELDFSDAVNITTEVLSNTAEMPEICLADLADWEAERVARDLPENNPPEGTPEIILMNPDSIQDGKCTTETMFFIATRWNNVDLCYDPEGGPLTMIQNDSFPTGYITYYTDDIGSLAGYAILIRNAGQYPLAFAFVDRYGAASEIFYANFDISRRGIFETIDGSLASENDQHQYDVTVDFSTAEEYYLGTLRTGLGGFSTTVYDSTGTKVGYTECGGPGPSQSVGIGITLARPDGITGEYTYSVRVTAIKSKYVAGDTAFRLAYGKSSQKQYFFEDVADGMELPYYHRVRSYTQNSACYVQSNAVSDYGYYYKIDATGQETVTLSSDTGKIDFRVLDATTFMPLFDSRELVPHKVENMSSYFTVARLNFEAGKSYYIVVYDRDSTGVRVPYAITVGDPRLTSGSLSCELSARTVTANQPCTISFTIEAPEGVNAYASMVSYRPNSPAWANNFAALSPGTTNWRTFGLLNLDYDYDNPNVPLVNAVGEWLLRVTPDKSGYYPGGTFRIYYFRDII